MLFVLPDVVSQWAFTGRENDFISGKNDAAMQNCPTQQKKNILAEKSKFNIHHGTVDIEVISAVFHIICILFQRIFICISDSLGRIKPFKGVFE